MMWIADGVDVSMTRGCCCGP